MRHREEAGMEDVMEVLLTVNSKFSGWLSSRRHYRVLCAVGLGCPFDDQNVFFALDFNFVSWFGTRDDLLTILKPGLKQII